MRRVESLEKTLMLGGIGGRRSGRQRMRLLDGITDSMDVSLSELWELVNSEQGLLACCDSWGHEESDMTERLKWTELIHFYLLLLNISLKCIYQHFKWCLNIWNSIINHTLSCIWRKKLLEQTSVLTYRSSNHLSKLTFLSRYPTTQI